jgi:hypothetical protein
MLPDESSKDAIQNSRGPNSFGDAGAGSGAGVGTGTAAGTDVDPDEDDGVCGIGGVEVPGATNGTTRYAA